MSRKTTPTRIAVANLIALSGMLALPAQATLVVNVLTATASTRVNALVPLVNGPQTDSNYISQYASVFNDNSSASASAWGNSLGTYRASGEGMGVFESVGRFQRDVSLTNNNAFATDYSLNFFIYYGSMSASSNGASGSGFGSYDLSIKQNNSSTLFASGAKIESDGTLTTTGTTLSGAFQNGGSYSWGGTYVTLNLGSLAVGASTSINFDLVSTAFGNFGFDGTGNNNGDGGYGCYGSELTRQVSDTSPTACTGSVYASLGDPNDFFDNPGEPSQFVLTERPTGNQVPLPGSLPLLGLGLAVLAYSRKYRLR